MWYLPFGTDNQRELKIVLLRRKNYKKNYISYPTEIFAYPNGILELQKKLHSPKNSKNTGEAENLSE